MDTSTIALRPLATPDADVLGAWASDHTFCEHAGWSSGTPAASRKFWSRQIEEPPTGLIRLAAEERETLVGYIDLHGDDPSERELGFVIGPSQRWGHGLGGRVAAAGLAYGFTRLDLHAVWAEALLANAPSVSILRSLGMQETGFGGTELFRGTESRYLQFRITRADWASRTPAG